ncbi:hypothetical protein RB213_014435 [Colletotrichum asianum]
MVFVASRFRLSAVFVSDCRGTRLNVPSALLARGFVLVASMFRFWANSSPTSPVTMSDRFGCRCQVPSARTKRGLALVASRFLGCRFQVSSVRLTRGSDLAPPKPSFDAAPALAKTTRVEISFIVTSRKCVL